MILGSKIVRSSMLKGAPQAGSVWCSFWTSVRSCLGRSTTAAMPCSSQGMTSGCAQCLPTERLTLSTGKLLSTRCLTGKSPFPPWSLPKYLGVGRGIPRYANILFYSKVLPAKLSVHWGSSSENTTTLPVAKSLFISWHPIERRSVALC